MDKDWEGAMSRLDRAMVSLERLQMWPNATQYIFDRSISDQGLRPFKVFNYWIEKLEFVKKAYGSCDIQGWGAYVKFKHLKKDIKRWSACGETWQSTCYQY